ncbi:hypothetical protein E2C01_037027 [Portunus trituberculatus]|uniref:Uncharacterized protein n=1 Tax=Portunus trituberculatus TaxID=210409 RepID=A0A5B7FAB3_PORTR|nr:hypothetical protein [Portunus trituberculatus]
MVDRNSQQKPDEPTSGRITTKSKTPSIPLTFYLTRNPPAHVIFGQTPQNQGTLRGHGNTACPKYCVMAGSTTRQASTSLL